ncbi:plakophilin-1 [Myripristis murdjan]|uniref:plakophilin-1 n=1 Tax=Myripristis murdjan TaxID=586833 RepID=UPI001175E465|nr:plakophilin-1-like [Myripristis murdjan]
MTSLEPLRSIISMNNVDNTSLALPSVNQFRSGQQRVRDQVQTVRRIKSRHSSRSGSASLSPTSPAYDSVFIDTYRIAPSTINGGFFLGNGISKALSQDKNINRQIINNSKGSTIQRSLKLSNYQYEGSFAPVGPMPVGAANTSRSEPDLGWRLSMPRRAAPSQRLLSNRSSTHFTETSTNKLFSSNPPQPQPQFIMNGTGHTKTSSQFIIGQVEMKKAPSKHSIVENAPKIKGDSGSNDNSGAVDITLKEAVQYLSSGEEAYQHCGACFIQHNTFIDDKTKEEVLKLNGIPPLVALLQSPSVQVSQTASATLRNISFKNNSAKEEIQRCEGITEAVALLRNTDSSETQKQLTGLLWNLSSVDSLKPDLVKSALPVLMESVILPYTTGPDRTINNNLDPEVFFNATGCLRNLSSAKQSNRQAMRKCRGLVDSLVSYVKDCVEADRPDDKSVENSVCILHNLTFQLQAEAPALFSRITALSRTTSRTPSQGDTGPIGCFSPQSSKVLEHENHFDYAVAEDQNPQGAGWLIHSKTLQAYLSLLGSSQREETQEACCGALQNLTTHQGAVSAVMSQAIVQKLNGLQVIAPLLRSNKANLQRNTVALVGNLAKNLHLHSSLARQALPELVGIMSAGTVGANESDDTLAMACQTAQCVLLKEPDLGKHLLNNKLINSLNDISHNKYFPKSSKAAALFLYNLWSEKDIQSFLKKQGMSKASFVNDITTAAHKSVQVVE